MSLWRRKSERKLERGEAADLIDLSDPRVQRIMKVSRIMSGIGTKLMFAPAYKGVRTPYGRKIMAQRRAAGKAARRARSAQSRRSAVVRRKRQKRNAR